MPTISDPNTVKALARGYLANRKGKEKGLLAAGYSSSYSRTSKGMKLYEKQSVIDAIAEIEAETCKECDLQIKTRLQRQSWWSKIMDDPDASRADKLRASELLGRSEADFTDNIQDSRGDTPDPLSESELAWLRELAGRMPHLSKETG